MMRYFTLEYWMDEDWYVGRLKEVPGVFSQGASLQELEENIRDAYELVMEEEEGALRPNSLARTWQMPRPLDETLENGEK